MDQEWTTGKTIQPVARPELRPRTGSIYDVRCPPPHSPLRTPAVASSSRAQRGWWISLAFSLVFATVLGAASTKNATRDGEEFVISVSGSRPAVAMAKNGGFLVAWQGSDGDGVGIMGRRYGPDGEALGPEFQVNTETAGRQDDVSVVRAGDGSFVVVWSSRRPWGYGYRPPVVVARHYDAEGRSHGPEFPVSRSEGANPSVAGTADGRFVVVWQSSAFPDAEIEARRYSTEGEPTGPEFQVNTYSTGQQYFPAVSSGPEGEWVAVWGGTGEIRGQRFKGRSLFSDGFESGDTSAWSNTVP